MYTFLPAIAVLALAGSTAAYAATANSAERTAAQTPPPVMQPAPSVYHEANTASPIATHPDQNKPVIAQATQKQMGSAQNSAAKIPSKEVASVVAPMSNYGQANLTSRLDQLSSKIHSAHQAGKLTELQYRELRHGYALVRRNVDQARDRYGREIPDHRLWALNGQIRYLSNEVNKLVG